MEFYLTSFYIIVALLFIIIIVKTIMFFSGGRRHKLTSWLYFTKYSIYNSRTPEIAKKKNFQNTLSIIIFIFFIFAIILLLMSHFA